MKTKIQKLFEIHLLAVLDLWVSQLESGDLHNFELSLRHALQVIHAGIMEIVLNDIGRRKSFHKKLKDLGSELGLRDLKLRKVRLQTVVGIWITYKSYYGCQLYDGCEVETRHLSQTYWGCLKKSSPAYYSLVSQLSAVCPSYEIASQVLSDQGIKSNAKRIRALSTHTGAIGAALGLSAQLDKSENMSGLRVVVQIDGGRSRIRTPKKDRSKKGYMKYETPWREPKLIAIHVLDKDGNIGHSIRKPIYRASVQDAKSCMDDLVETLKVLGVSQAQEVQFLADGASFIWKRIRSAFRKAGVAAKKITYTLDYYHAVEHLKDLSELLPLTKPERDKHFKEWKADLWEGLANTIVRKFKRLIRQASSSLSDTMKTALKYFKKHHDRMQYKRFKRRKLLCGSGLVESAIRRVINLRFKGSSAFWYEDNLNNMLVLRCAFLSRRWHNLMKAIQLEVKRGGTT